MSCSWRSWCPSVYHCLCARGHSCPSWVGCTQVISLPHWWCGNAPVSSPTERGYKHPLLTTAPLPKISGLQSCFLCATMSFPSQLVGLAGKTQRSLNLCRSRTYQGSCVPLAKNESKEKQTDNKHKTAELQLLQHKSLTLASLPLREDDNSFSGKAMCQLWWAKGANSLKWFCHLQL